MCQKHLGFNYCFDDSYCKICKGYCCKGEGYVFLEQSDIESIAIYLNLEIEQFIQTYTRKFYDKIVLANVKINGEYACCFLNDGLCEIYPSRPSQCKTFPFWDSMKNLSIEELKQLCPAIKK
ncbi:MAG: YkgJ family cysteine cluster protein [Desulfurella sp.]|uniref:YkgJ family cysteine cluster protein n=1 Tax=Desulfurella sp. TaxID=1962857 RepID=UPI003D12E2A7